MIITCPECDARFVLPEKALGPEGRRLRCGKCRHIWYKIPPERTFEERTLREAVTNEALKKQAAAMSAASTGGKVYLPAITSAGRFPHEWLVFTVCFVWLLLSSLYLFGPSIIYRYEFTRPFYKLVGVIPVEGVKLYDTKIEKVKQYGQDSLSISGIIANESKHMRYVPNLQIVQKNRDGKILDKAMLKSGYPELAPGAETDYRNIVPIISTDVTQVVVDVGDAITLRRRLD